MSDRKKLSKQKIKTKNFVENALILKRRQSIQMLDESGLLQLRGGVGIVAEIMGISRASVYNALKSFHPNLR